MKGYEGFCLIKDARNKGAFQTRGLLNRLFYLIISILLITVLDLVHFLFCFSPKPNRTSDSGIGFVFLFSLVCFSAAVSLLNMFSQAQYRLLISTILLSKCVRR